MFLGLLLSKMVEKAAFLGPLLSQMVARAAFLGMALTQMIVRAEFLVRFRLKWLSFQLNQR